MPLPGGLNVITVTGTYLTPNGAPMPGSVSFTPSADLTDSTGQVILRAVPITATLSAGLKPLDRFVALGAHMLHEGEAVRVADTAGVSQ